MEHGSQWQHIQGLWYASHRPRPRNHQAKNQIHPHNSSVKGGSQDCGPKVCLVGAGPSRLETRSPSALRVAFFIVAFHLSCVLTLLLSPRQQEDGGYFDGVERPKRSQNCTSWLSIGELPGGGVTRRPLEVRRRKRLRCPPVRLGHCHTQCAPPPLFHLHRSPSMPGRRVQPFLYLFRWSRQQRAVRRGRWNE